MHTPTTLYRRKQANDLLDKLRAAPDHIAIVAGPRQVGKTTMVRQVLAEFGPNHQFHAVDEPEFPDIPADGATAAFEPGRQPDTKWLSEKWVAARAKARASRKRYVLVFDEIQKIARWSEVVKGLWDADRAEGLDMHVVLLGSSPLLMKRGMTESLAGRFELVRVTHWSFLEMYEAFNFSLDDYLFFGGYPGGASMIRAREDKWRRYVLDGLVAPSIDNDILMMVRVDKPALLRQTFQLGCIYSAQILSYTKMLGHLEGAGNTVTLASYLNLLEQAGLLVGLQKYAGAAHRARASQPKLNVLNPCLLTVHKTYNYAEALADRTYWGQITESAIGAHLYNSGAPEISLTYWRESPHEVDYVIERGPRLAAIEVKSGANRGAVAGLDEFVRRNPTARRLVVGTGGIPIAEFLSYPAEHWLG